MPPPPERRFSVVIDPDLAQRLRIMAVSLDMSVPELINARLRTIVESEFPAIAKSLLEAMDSEPT